MAAPVRIIRFIGHLGVPFAVGGRDLLTPGDCIAIVETRVTPVTAEGTVRVR